MTTTTTTTTTTKKTKTTLTTTTITTTITTTVVTTTTIAAAATTAIITTTLPKRIGGNQKRNQQSTNADQKSIETVFSIAICRQWGDKWQSKTLFLLIYDLRSSIVLAFSIAAYPVCLRCRQNTPILRNYVLSVGELINRPSSQNCSYFLK